MILHSAPVVAASSPPCVCVCVCVYFKERGLHRLHIPGQSQLLHQDLLQQGD